MLDWRVRPSQDLRDRVVLVLDDILDEGHTLHAIIKYLEEEGARGPFRGTGAQESRPQGLPRHAREFTGLEVADRFLFGCGMDYKGYWRNARASMR